ncbi:MAG TPA: hypothetical protein PK990_06710 [Salinivirgaceae bacterium]|mgnify:CR=1 FL=1|nr:hypothetical protein [Salinivirgaceae bacterium]
MTKKQQTVKYLSILLTFLTATTMGAKAKIVPDFFHLQFAGDIGMISAGAGYQTSSKKTHVSFLMGFVPKTYIDFENNLVTLNIAATYQPLMLYFRDVKMAFKPLILGSGISVSLGETYQRYNTPNYPKGYYWWPTNSRIIVTVGQSISVFQPSRTISQIDLYSQLATNDLALYSYSVNTIVKMRHIFHFSFGAKIFIDFPKTHKIT